MQHRIMFLSLLLVLLPAIGYCAEPSSRMPGSRIFRKTLLNDPGNIASQPKSLQIKPRQTTLREVVRETTREIATLTSDVVTEDKDLQPFGRSFFLHGDDISPTVETNLAPSGYILGAGDTLKIIVWSEMGDETVYDVTVNPENQVYIPIIGVLGVSGLTVGQFEELVLGSLAGKYKHFKGQVTLTKTRTLQIFIAGEVVRPGAMVISALSTAFSALYRAGGPTDKGSMRLIKVIRNNQEITTIDLYRYFMRGDKSQDVTLSNGDTIFVPTVSRRVRLEGSVIRPAIYELISKTTLKDAIDMAGGLEPSAYSRSIKVFRWRGNARRVIYEIDTSEDPRKLASFYLEDGDEIMVEESITEISNVVKIEGAIRKPGEYAVTKGLTLSELIQNAGGIIEEETAPRVGQIIRKLVKGRTKIISFDLSRALSGDPAENHEIHPLDEIQIFTQRMIEPDTQIVFIDGAVRQPGEYHLPEGMKLRDLLVKAKGLTADASNEAEIARITKGRESELIRVDIKKAFKDKNEPDNIPLNPMDRVSILAAGDSLIAPESVTLRGELKRPGPYSLKERGETLAQLIRRAGGLTSEAFPEGLVLMRRMDKIMPEKQVEIAERVREELYDQATLDLQADLLRSGAKLSDVAAEKSLEKTGEESIKQALSEDVATEYGDKLISAQADSAKTLTGGLTMKSRVMTKEMLRIAVDIRAITNESGPGSMVLRDGDVIDIPGKPLTVTVAGAVINPSTHMFHENRSAKHYIERSGGFSPSSNHRRTVVVRPNGEVLPLRKVSRIQRGDIIIVPPKAKLVRKDWLKEAGQIAQILGNLAVVYKVTIDK